MTDKDVIPTPDSKQNGDTILLIVSQNMTISSSFNPTASSNTIKFLGFDINGKAAPYTLRVKTASSASDIVAKLKGEVEAIVAEGAEIEIE